MRRTNYVVPALVWVVLFVCAGADEPCAKHAKPKVDSKAVDSAFDRLKELAGDWQVAGPKDDARKGKIEVRYRLTAGGTALVETLFPGEDKEMVTVYHRDGDQLLLTHYCMAGNQPRMRAKAGGSKDQLVFEFAGGTNLDPAKDLHMHGYRLQFLDSDHIHAEWEYYRDGKAAGKHEFDLARTK
jgi:hypothetical protein